MKIILGSRGSDLALAQSRFIRGLLQKLPESPEVEIQIIKTSGDQIQNVPLSSVGDTPDERKGFFTKELEEALLDRRVDLAVHSYKDMPTADVPGLTIAAIPERVSNCDVLLFPASKRFSDEPPYLKPGSRIGTSSVRRISQLRYLWPEMEFVNLRGNVPTRIQKVVAGKTNSLEREGEDEAIDAVMLAEAGLNRLKAVGLFDKDGDYPGLLEGLEIGQLPADLFIPAPAQGALGIQCRVDDERILSLLKQLHQDDLALEVGAERLVLRELEGGCHLPLGAGAVKKEDGFELRIFLGHEAVNNRRGKSYSFTRFGRDSIRLAERVSAEIKEQLPVVITGRADRMAELKQKFSSTPLIEMPLLEIEYLKPSESELNQIREIVSKLESNGSQKGVCAAFSSPGVEALKKALDGAGIKLPAGIEWAVTGARTAETLQTQFPGAKVTFTSPDGTGAGLAREILKERSGVNPAIMAVAAERGRPEFYDILTGEGFTVQRFELYRSQQLEPSAELKKSLPPQCYIIFGSPSSVNAYFNHFPANGDHRYCAIGPTTATALQEADRELYMVAREADYEELLSELLG